MIRFLSILLMSILGACGGSSNSMQTPYFKLVKATSQEWIAGAKGSGRGTTYQFEIITKTGQQLEFRTAWIGKESFPLQAKVPLEKMDDPVKKGDVITLECTKRLYPEGPPEGMPEITKRPLPVEYVGDALIEYIVNDEKNYFVVTTLEKLPRINHM